MHSRNGRREGRMQAQQMNSLLGKILRIDPGSPLLESRAFALDT